MLMPCFLAHSGLHPEMSLCGIEQWMLAGLMDWPESVEVYLERFRAGVHSTRQELSSTAGPAPSRHEREAS